MKIPGRGAASLIVLAVGTAAFAHDFWIEPLDFRPAANAIVKLRLLVGDFFIGEGVARDAKRIREFVLIDPAGKKKEIVGVEGADPAGMVRLGDAGLYIASYRSQNARVELSGPKFESYLREEGLEFVSELRKSQGKSDAGAKETYSRCAKTLLRVGSGGGGDPARRLGLPLEIVAEADPYARTAGDALPFRVFFQDAPLKNVKVTALNRTAPDHSLSTTEARTDAEGRASLVLSRPGTWLVTAVHMIEAAPEKDADWESFWASLTFDLAPAVESRPASRPAR